ncbi:MAG: hypothetical protein U1F68_09035 [Gammaproteobacteria bacterium]
MAPARQRDMLDELLELARVDGAREAFLEVRPSSLIRRCAFIPRDRVHPCRRAARLLSAKDGREDAWVMAKGL